MVFEFGVGKVHYILENALHVLRNEGERADQRINDAVGLITENVLNGFQCVSLKRVGIIYFRYGTSSCIFHSSKIYNCYLQ